MRGPSQQNHDTVVRVSVAILASGMVLVGLSVAQNVFAPLMLAVVTGVIFAPLADRLATLGIPRTAVALGLLIVFFFSVAAVVFLAEPYVTAAIDEIPSIKYELRKLMFEYRDLIQGIDAMNREMEQALGSNDRSQAADMPTLNDALFLAPVILAQALVFFAGLFFFLTTRAGIYAWMSRRIGSRTDTGIIMQRICDAEQAVSRYFATISIINAGLGFAVGAGLMAIGLPGAVIWGIAVAVLNFVLYLGPAVLAVALLLAGIVNFDGVMSFAPPAIYLGCNLIEAQFITPGLVGKHIHINPFLIFVSLCFWLWLWGPIGGIVAIPITVILLKLFDIFGENPTTDERPAASA